MGPGDELHRHGIDVRIELPGVGCHLLDHPETLVTWSASRPVPDEGDSFWEIAVFTETQPGPMMAHVGTRPVVVPGYPPPAYGLSITPNAADSQSQGTLRLASADPAALPVIDPRYLSDTEGRDLAVLVEGIRLSRRLAAAPALAGWLADEVSCGSTATAPRSGQSAWRAQRRATVLIVDPTDMLRRAQLVCDLVSVSYEGARDHIDRLAVRYLGAGYDGPHQERLIVRLAPQRVFGEISRPRAAGSDRETTR